MEDELPFGEIKFGQVDNMEFVCSKTTATWLRAGGMTKLDGREVYLQQKDELRGGRNVVLGIWFK